MLSHHFKNAERYIQLRKLFVSQSWGDTMIRINEMIITPLITIFFLFFKKWDWMSLIPTALHTYSVWKDWCEYTELRFLMQRMVLKTAVLGGPCITTNEPTYMPYVYADAVTRVEQRYY